MAVIAAAGRVLIQWGENEPVEIGKLVVDVGGTHVGSGRITIRHEGGNTLTGTIEQVLSTHLAKGWTLVGRPGVV